MTDTQRWDMISCARDTGLQTPNIDKLAANGIRFNKAYTTQAVCQPARAGIFTGMYPNACGSWTNVVGLGDDIHTIGERLQDKGVHTAFIGKWHLDGGDYFGLGKSPKGWDAHYWFDMRNYLHEMSDEDRMLSRDPKNMETHDFSEDFTFAHKCTDRAIDFLENHGEEDFFLTLSYDEPHLPCICPREYYEKYEDYTFPKSENVKDDLANKPDFQKYWAGERLHLDKDKLQLEDKYFFGCNEFVDYEIGRVLDKIEELVPDAIVMYTSDHGTMMYSHSLTLKGPSGYDEINRIPFIIKGKDVPQNIVDDAPVSHIDIAPTIFDLFNLKIPSVFAGNSLLPQIEGNVKQVNEQVFFEFGRFERDHDCFGGLQIMRAAFDGRYKLVINLLSTDELYDTLTDPGEMNNLILDEETKAIRNKLHQAILNNMDEHRDLFRGYYWDRRPWNENAAEPQWYDGLTRQREDEEYEERQYAFFSGLPMETAIREIHVRSFFS